MSDGLFTGWLVTHSSFIPLKSQYIRKARKPLTYIAVSQSVSQSLCHSVKPVCFVCVFGRLGVCAIILSFNHSRGQSGGASIIRAVHQSIGQSVGERGAARHVTIAESPFGRPLTPSLRFLLFYWATNCYTAASLPRKYSNIYQPCLCGSNKI